MANVKNLSIIKEAIGLNAIISLRNGEIVNGFVKELTKGIVVVVESDNTKSYILENDISLVRIPSGNSIKQTNNCKNDFDENEYYSSSGLATMNKEMISKKESKVEFSMMGAGNVENKSLGPVFERKTSK